MYLRDGSVRKFRRSHNDPGVAHELTFTCYKRYPLLNADRSRQWLLDALKRAQRRWDFELWAYVIMPDHVHLLICPRQVDYQLSSILRAIKQPVAQQAVSYLHRHAPPWLKRLRVVRSNGRVEHRFWQQGGGYDRNIVQAKTAWATVQYIHANPVRRELAACPTDWPWSSARWYAGLDNVLLEMDGQPPGCPLR